MTEHMCIRHEMRDGRPDPDCSLCGGDEPHRHHGERSDVRLEARRRMGGGYD